MAQSIKDEQMLTCNSDGKSCSFKEEFLKSPYYINKNSADFGHFSGADCDATNYSFDIDKNYWFTRLENISEISVSAYDDVGKRIENNLIDYNNWNLQFLCWSLLPHEIYATKGDPWPTSFDTVEEDGTATKVDGFYPYSDSFTPFYMNTSLDLYEKNVKVVNGRKTLFLYPVFSTGKNYFDFYRGNKGDQIKDLITVTTQYDISKYNKTYYTYFNGTVTGLVNKNENENVYDVYSLDNFIIKQDELKDDASPKLGSITIKNDINRDSSDKAWAGEGDFVHTVKDEQGNPLNLLNMSGDKNLQSGRYNIYIFVKHSTSYAFHDDAEERAITADEVSSINSDMKNNNRIRYSSIAGQAYMVTHGFGFYADYRDYYVYFERIYEPRIIGGPTLDLNYDSELSKSLQFLRKGSSGNDNNRYQRRGVELQGDNWIEYPLSGGRTLLFKDYYFGVMLNPEVSFTSYAFDLVEDGPDTDYAAAGFPSITYQDQNGVDKVEYYKSESIFETYNPDAYDDDNADVKIRNDSTGEETKYDGTGTQSFVLIKPKNIDTTGKGIYNIVIDIKYPLDEDGSDEKKLIVPTSVIFYGYKLSNLFVNIMETDENGEVEMGHTQGGTHYEHFVNTDVYEYTRTNYYELANVTLDDVFTAKDDSTKTLREILTELKEDGKCLEDLVTSRYITLENLDPDNKNYIPFTIQKNYVFKIVSIPAELQ